MPLMLSTERKESRTGPTQNGQEKKGRPVGIEEIYSVHRKTRRHSGDGHSDKRGPTVGGNEERRECSSGESKQGAAHLPFPEAKKNT